jgi:hypothetical protein
MTAQRAARQVDVSLGYVGTLSVLMALAGGCNGSGANASSPGSSGETTGGATAAATGGLASTSPASGGAGANGPDAAGGTAATGGGPLAASAGAGTGGAGTAAAGAETGGASTAGGMAGGGAATGGGTARGGAATGGRSMATGGAVTGGSTAASAGAATAGAGGTASDATPADVHAIPGSTTVGLEWSEVPEATSYNVYWSTSAGVTPATGQLVSGVARGHVERGLTNGTTYHYVVTAVTSAGESAPSVEASATPAGEWVLEQLGTGDFEAVQTPGRVPAVPVEERIHVLLFAEGYTREALATLHSEASHESRDNDVDRWIDEVFAIEPYALFPEAIVVWFLPRASNTTIRDTPSDTAFQVPVSLGTLPSVGRPTTETASRAWEAIGSFPYPAVAYDGPWRDARNLVAAFLLYDPDVGRAYGSGVTLTLSNPSSSRERIAAAFAMGHAHEFTHAFSGLTDEYLETSSTAPNNWSDTSNVVGTNTCGELPWAHLLAGSAINPNTEGLVGAFGDPSLGFHSELLCLMNGTHDNGEFFARDEGGSCRSTSCTLRVEDRMCNFCREITALRVFQRSGILPGDTDLWTREYRDAFYAHYGFVVPDQVPQSNDVSRPENGTPIFQDCVP